MIRLAIFEIWRGRGPRARKSHLFLFPSNFNSDLVEFKQFRDTISCCLLIFLRKMDVNLPNQCLNMAVPGRGSQAATKALDCIKLGADRANRPMWVGGKQISEVLPPILNYIPVAFHNTSWEKKFSQFLGNLERQTAWPGLLHKTLVSAALLPPLGAQICGTDPTSMVGEKRGINWARAPLTAAEVST